MEFTALFLAFAIAMVIAWRGSRAMALALSVVLLVACAVTFIHHATDTLKLSF